MDFAVLAHFSEYAERGYLAVYGDGDVALDPAVVDEAFLEAGILSVEVVDDLADVGAFDFDAVAAVAEFLHEGRDEHCCHGLAPI